MVVGTLLISAACVGGLARIKVAMGPSCPVFMGVFFIMGVALMAVALIIGGVLMDWGGFLAGISNKR